MYRIERKTVRKTKQNVANSNSVTSDARTVADCLVDDISHQFQSVPCGEEGGKRFNGNQSQTLVRKIIIDLSRNRLKSIVEWVSRSKAWKLSAGTRNVSHNFLSSWKADSRVRRYCCCLANHDWMKVPSNFYTRTGHMYKRAWAYVNADGAFAQKQQPTRAKNFAENFSRKFCSFFFLVNTIQQNKIEIILFDNKLIR